MALANEMVLDLTETLKQAEKMDKYLASWVEMSKKIEQNLTKALSQTSGKNSKSAVSSVSTDAKESIDSVNILTNEIQKLGKQKAPSKGNDAFSTMQKRIEELLKQLEKAKKDIELYKQAIGTGKKTYVDWGQSGLKEAEQRAKSLMAQITALENTYKNLRNSSANIGSITGNTLEGERQKRNIEQQREYYKRLEAESKRSENQKRKDAEKTEEERYRLALARMNKEQKEQQKREEENFNRQKRNIEQQNRMYAQMAQRQAQEQQRIANTPKKASLLISQQGQAKSLNELRVYANEIKRTMNTLNPKSKEWKELNKILNKTNNQIMKMSQTMRGFSQESQRARGFADQLRRSIGLMFSLSQISGYIKKLVAVRGEFELQQRSLEAILQNKEAANEIWDKTVQLAVKSPFQLKELVTYTKQMAAYRVETEKLHDTTKMLADVSAGLGVDMQRLILAYGQVKAANYLRGTELRQFSEAGINILGELAKYFTEIENRVVSVGEVFEMVSKRMVSFADVEEIFKRITSEGGTFYNMQELQAQTIKGMTSNLRDSLDIMLNDIGASNEDLIKGSIRLARQLLENWEEWSNWVFPILATFLARWALVGVVSRKNAMSVRLVFDAFEKGWNRFGAAFTRFNVYTAALSALVAIIWGIVRAVKSANKEIRELNKIELKGTLEASKMASEYKRLADIVSDSTKSYDEQKKALETLKRTYEDIIPNHLLEAQTIKELAGNYDKATNAIKNYQAAQIKQKQLSYIEDEYSRKITKREDKLVDKLYDSLKFRVEGLERSDLVSVVGELTTQFFNGEIAIEDFEETLNNLMRLKFGDIIDIDNVISYVESGNGAIKALGETLEEYLNKTERINNFKPKLDESEILRSLNEIKERYKNTSNDIQKYLTVIRDAQDPKKKDDVSTKQYNDAIANLDKIFKDVGQKAPKWNEIINQSFLLDDAVVKANENLWTKMMKEITDITVEEADEATKTKFLDVLKEEQDAFAGNKLQKEARRVAMLIAEDQNITLEGLRAIIPSVEQSTEEFAKTIKEQIDFYEKSIEQKNIDKRKAADFGYDDIIIDRMKKQLPFLKEFYTYFYHKEDSTGANKIFEERLRILREMYDSYKDLNKTFDATKSIEGVDDKYRQAFKDAFDFDFDVWGNFFTNEDDYKEALQKLKVMTKDAKDQLKVEIEKGRITWDIAIKLKTDQDKDLKNELQSYFDQYDMGLELDKLGVSGEFANALFGIESMDLDKLRDIVAQFKDQFIGEDMEKEYKAFQDKLTEIEVKARQERMKGYLEYTRTTISQRAQLELKAMRDLADARKDIQDKEVLSQVESGIQKKLSEDLDKLNWEAFKSSDVFVKIFNDLDNVSQDALESMIKQLNDYKDEWKNLPIQEMKEVATQLEKMEKALAMKKAGDSPFSYASIRTFGQQAKSREEVSNAQNELLKADKLLLKYKSQEESLQTINQLVNEKKDATQAIEEYNAKYGTNLETQWADQQDILNMTKEQTDELQKLAKKETERKKNAQGIVDANEAYLFALQKQHQYLGDTLQMANDLYGAFESVLAVCDEWGAELDESVAIFAQAGMDMTNTVIQTIQLQIQLNIAAQEATGLGVAMNTAMSVIGWIVMAVQLLTTALSAIAKAHDNSLQKQIERDAEAVELLQKRFEKLEEAIDNAMSFGQYQKEFDEAKRNLKDQIRLTQDMIALEEAKKKTDKDAIKGYKDEIEDYNEQLKEMEEKRYEDMGGFGSDEAYKDAAESFIDAWLSAYKETGDGLEALQGQWDEYFDNLVKKQMVMHISNKYIKGLLEQVDKAIGRDGIVTGDEMANLKAMAEQSSIELNAIMKQFADALGIEGLTDGTKLEGLSESIQGVTEVTAQALEAILNSMRFYVIDNNTQLKQLVEKMDIWSNPQSSLISELRNQTTIIDNIYNLFYSVVDQSTKTIKVS